MASFNLVPGNDNAAGHEEEAAGLGSPTEQPQGIDPEGSKGGKSWKSSVNKLFHLPGKSGRAAVGSSFGSSLDVTTGSEAGAALGAIFKRQRRRDIPETEEAQKRQLLLGELPQPAKK
eukprot:scaffold99212_cov35-Prasinocladus_malaysianus.AAC.1